jgi:hypothetical protein
MDVTEHGSSRHPSFKPFGQADQDSPGGTFGRIKHTYRKSIQAPARQTVPCQSGHMIVRGKHRPTSRKPLPVSAERNACPQQFGPVEYRGASRDHKRRVFGKRKSPLGTASRLPGPSYFVPVMSYGRWIKRASDFTKSDRGCGCTDVRKPGFQQFRPH